MIANVLRFVTLMFGIYAFYIGVDAKYDPNIQPWFAWAAMLIGVVILFTVTFLSQPSNGTFPVYLTRDEIETTIEAQYSDLADTQEDEIDQQICDKFTKGSRKSSSR